MPKTHQASSAIPSCDRPVDINKRERFARIASTQCDERYVPLLKITDSRIVAARPAEHHCVDALQFDQSAEALEFGFHGSSGNDYKLKRSFLKALINSH